MHMSRERHYCTNREQLSATTHLAERHQVHTRTLVEDRGRFRLFIRENNRLSALLGCATSSSGADGPTNGASPLEELGDDKSLKINGTNGTSTRTPKASTTTKPRRPQQLLRLGRLQAPIRLQQQPVVVTAARRRFFNQIITKCVLQLLMIETVNELFSNDAVYAQIPSPELLRLMAYSRSPSSSPRSSTRTKTCECDYGAKAS
jgi:hypothetical protein